MYNQCKNYIKVLILEVEKRLPNNLELLKSISLFLPTKMLSQVSRPNVNDLPLQLLNQNINVIESQCRKIVFVDWKMEFEDNKVPEDPHCFWPVVLGYTNSVGEHLFKELAELALCVLSFPISNAVVERVFSQVNCVKNRLRSRLSLSTLECIILIRTFLSFKSNCCKDFIVTTEMLAKFSNDMYNCKKNDVCDDEFQMLIDHLE